MKQLTYTQIRILKKIATFSDWFDIYSGHILEFRQREAQCYRLHEKGFLEARVQFHTNNWADSRLMFRKTKKADDFLKEYRESYER